MEIEVAGDGDGFGKLAREIDLDCLPSDYNFGGQLEGVDLILEGDEVTFILCLRPVNK